MDAAAATVVTRGIAMGKPMGVHHVAYACRDIDETNRFYTELMGMPLVHTEVKSFDSGFFRHVFYDMGDGTCIAFFDVHGVGEKEDWHSEISTGNGLPVWVNHIAFAADVERQEAARARFEAAGIKPLMEVDHGWCHSLYYLDPNGIMAELCRDTPGLPDDHDAALDLLAWRPDPTPPR